MHSRFKTTTAAFAGQHPTKMQAERLCRLRQVLSTVIQPDNCQTESVHSPPVGYGVKVGYTAESRRFQPENKKAAISLPTDNGDGMTRWIINLVNYIIAYPGGHSKYLLKLKKGKIWIMSSMSLENNTFLSTREFAKQVGVSSQTIRRWDKMGKLKPHHKTPCGYRYYTQEQVTEMFNPDCTDTTGRGCQNE